MKKLKPFKSVLVVTIIGLILFFSGCYEFDFVIQPTEAEKNSSFEVQVSITTDSEGDGAEYYPYFGIKLPVGWTVQDSIAFTHLDGTGILVYSDSLVQEMNLIDPPEDGYYWWVSAGTEPVIYIDADTYLFNPIITTDSSTGTFFLDYMAGDNYGGEGRPGLNRTRSNDHFIGVDLAEHVIVTSSEDNGPGSLREALNLVAFDGSITFDIPSGSSITLGSELSVFKNIRLSGPVDDPISISGDHQTRIFNIYNNCEPELSYMTLINGDSEKGGCIYCEFSDPNLHNLIISNCHASSGGAIYLDHSDATLKNIAINDNHALWGGGLFIDQGNPAIADVSFAGNISDENYGAGGAVFCRSSNATFENVIIQNNIAYDGGGVYLYFSDPVFTSVEINENSAMLGGGISSINSHPGIKCSVFTGNSASLGEGLYLENSGPVLQNVTFSGHSGSAVHCNSSQVILTHSIMWNNIPYQVSFQAYTNPSSLSVSNSDFKGGQAGVYANSNGEVNWLEGNIDEDPLFESSGGHPYQLSAGSPCIDAGNPDTTGLNLPMWDLIGNYRLWDGDMDGDTIVDMGAYEFGSVGVSTPELKVPDSGFQVEVFPNPTFEIVHIEYEIENPSLVSIRVYNLIGEMVAVLQEGLLQDGKHRILWNAEGLTAGLYFCSMQIGQESITRKIIKH
jgi:hypothetical protein